MDRDRQVGDLDRLEPGCQLRAGVASRHDVDGVGERARRERGSNGEVGIGRRRAVFCEIHATEPPFAFRDAGEVRRDDDLLRFTRVQGEAAGGDRQAHARFCCRRRRPGTSRGHDVLHGPRPATTSHTFVLAHAGQVQRAGIATLGGVGGLEAGRRFI